MFLLKSGVDSWVPVVLTTTTDGTPAKNVQYDNVSVTLIKNDGTVVDIGPLTVNTDWQEIITGTYSQKGYYLLKIHAANLDTEGALHYGVGVTGVDFYDGIATVRTNTEKEIYDRIGAPVDVSISADLQNINASVGGDGGFGATDRTKLNAVADALPTVGLIAAQGDVTGAVTSLETWMGTNTFNSSDRSNLSAIKGKTDNLPAAPAAVSDVTSARDNVNTNTNTRTGEIKGSGWLGTETLRALKIELDGVNSKTTNLPSDPASQAAICGVGYDPLTDALHQLQLNLSGLTSGSGGFLASDRANLTALVGLMPASVLPSKADLDAVQGSENIYGSNVRRTISESYVVQRQIKAQTDKTQGTIASTTDVNAARDYLAGTGFVVATDTLRQISLSVGVNNFGSTDRTTLNAIKTELDGVKSTEDLNRTDVIGIRAKTDNLPTDPASNSHIDTVMGTGANAFTVDDHNAIQSILTDVGRIPANPATTTSGFQNTDRDVISSINGKVQNLPADPASTTNVSVLSNKIGTPVGATVVADITAVQTKLGTPRTPTIAGDIGDTTDTVIALK